MDGLIDKKETMCISQLVEGSLQAAVLFLLLLLLFLLMLFLYRERCHIYYFDSMTILTKVQLSSMVVNAKFHSRTEKIKLKMGHL